MGKARAGKPKWTRAVGMQVAEVSSKVATPPEAKASRARASTVAAAAGAPEVAAATVVLPKAGVTVTAEEDEAVETRSEQIEALPEFGEITGLQAVDSGMSLNIVPLRSGKMATAYFDESTGVSIILGKTKEMRDLIDDAISTHAKGWDLSMASVGGRPDLTALRCSEPFKNNRCGVYKIRVLENVADMVTAALNGLAVVTAAFGVEYTHETIIPDDFYPGAVIEQIYMQTGLAAAFKRDISVGKNVFVYQFAVQSAAKLTLVEKRGHLVQLGKHGKFAMRETERKLSFETIFAYGCSGVGSAKDLLKEPVAASLAVPSDLVRIAGVPGVIPGMGTVVAIKYPYSKANYDAAAQLLDQGQFKLRHSATSSFAIEITLAITPIELGKRLALKLLKDADSSDSEDEEEEALDLRIKEGGFYFLEPDCLRARQGGSGGRRTEAHEETATVPSREEVTDGWSPDGDLEVGDGSYGLALGGMVYKLSRYPHLTSRMVDGSLSCLIILWCLWQSPRDRTACNAAVRTRGPRQAKLADGHGRILGNLLVVARWRGMEHLLGWGYGARQRRRRK